VTEESDIKYKWDFFISYTRADQGWAEWIAWVLEEDGHRVLIQAWDFVPGSHWVQGMQAGTRDSARTVAVLSHSYLDSVYGGAEWQAALASDPDGAGRRLLVVRVEDCQRPGLLANVVGVDLFGRSEADAKATLRTMVKAAETGRAKPTTPPRFPGDARAVPHEPSFPGDDPNGAHPGTRPQNQPKEGAAAGEKNRFQRLDRSNQAAVIGGVFSVLAAVVAAVVAGIFALLNSKGSPPSPGPTSAQSSPASTKSSSSLIKLVSPGVHAVAYSFDGNYLAAANANGAVRVWRTDTWRLAHTMVDPHSKGVSSVAFNPANTFLATGDINGHVYLWSRTLAKILSDPSGSAIRSVAFSHDNKYLAAGDASGTVNVWQTSKTNKWRLVSSMHDPSSSGINSVAFSSINSLMAADDASGHAYIFANGHAKVLTDPSGAAIQSIVFTADNSALVGGDSSGHIYVWQVDSRKVTEQLSDPNTKGVNSVSFDSGTKTIAAADGNGKAYLWLYKLIHVLQYPANSALLSVSYSPDDNHLAVASASGKVYVRLVNSLPAANIYSPLPNFAATKAFSVSGTANNIPADDHLWLIVRAPDNLWYPVERLHVDAQKWSVTASNFCIQPGRQDVQVWMVPDTAESPLLHRTSDGRTSGLHSLPTRSILKAHVTTQVPRSVKSTCR
jgi:WD40 repeat protein